MRESEGKRVAFIQTGRKETELSQGMRGLVGLLLERASLGAYVALRSILLVQIYAQVLEKYQH